QLDGQIQGGGKWSHFDQSRAITVQNTYTFGASGPDEYAFDCWTCGDMLFINNIVQHVRSGFISEMGEGLVIAYNYHINHFKNGYLQGAQDNHGPGAAYWLVEGNDSALGTELENYWGSSNFITIFRNHVIGWQSDSDGNDQTVPGYSYALSRFTNYIGNVFGRTGTHTIYQTDPSNPSVNNTNCNKSICVMGLGANCSNGDGL